MYWHRRQRPRKAFAQGGAQRARRKRNRPSFVANTLLLAEQEVQNGPSFRVRAFAPRPKPGALRTAGSTARYGLVDNVRHGWVKKGTRIMITPMRVSYAVLAATIVLA